MNRTAHTPHPIDGFPIARLYLLALLVFLATALPEGAARLRAETAQDTNAAPDSRVIVVVGAEGDAAFATNFVRAARLWTDTSARAGAHCDVVGLTAPQSTNDLAHLRALLASEPTSGPTQLWVVLLGHGTFDGREARFNLRGPDLAASDLAAWLKPIRRTTILINGASGSAPFIKALSATNHIVVTATRSGTELNLARFGRFISEAIADPASDVDQDGQTSVLEAYLSASRQVAEWYKLEGRLATEHALLDDNGDGLGTPADWFKGLRAVKRARDNTAVDGLRAHQVHLIRSPFEAQLTPEARAERDSLERRISQLRERKGRLPEPEYLDRLEQLLLALGGLYEPVPLNTRTNTDNVIPAPQAPQVPPRLPAAPPAPAPGPAPAPRP